jgi:argininosuccinate lyase
MKLWQKNTTAANEAVERFTTGRDREMDLYLAPYDVLGSLAHLAVIEAADLITTGEAAQLRIELRRIYQLAISGEFRLEPGMEDVHSQIEWMLTQTCGDAGKKIHTGRSRNDQVITAIKLFLRTELKETVQAVEGLFQQMQTKSATMHGVIMPGYTHFQVAMPSSFGLWLEAYAECLCDDLSMVLPAWELANKNPLGSAAGYGSSFPLDRDLSTRLLGFHAPHINVITAQMSRGKTERVVAQALAAIAATLSRWAYDCCLFLSQNFSFIRFPDHLTTGSSIMPHKKNPDVFELIRARCNAFQGLPQTITLITNNLPSGYHRDMQLLKEYLFPAFASLRECIELAGIMVEGMEINPEAAKQDMYRYMYTVEEVNRLVMEGIPFREAYQTIGATVEAGQFTTSGKQPHSHLGSIDNPGSARITAAMQAAVARFNFALLEQCEKELSAE